MPRGERRRTLYRNILTISALLPLFRVLPTIAADYNVNFHQQNVFPTSTGNFQDATLPTEFMIKRQLLGNLTTIPFSLPTSIPLATNSDLIPDETPIPLLISPYIPPSSSRSLSFSPFSTSGTSSSTQTSSNGNSSATAINANQSSRIAPINFLPFIVVASFFIILLIGWCLHGWCTRRPKEKFVVAGTMESRKRGGWFWGRRGGWTSDKIELVCGPAYPGQDVEEYATVRQAGRYRWPSLPTTNHGHRYQSEPDDRDPFLPKSIPVEFAGLPLQTVRSVPSAEPRREPSARWTFMSPTTTTGPMSPTSIALKELYEVVLRSEYGPDSGESEERTSHLGVGSGVMSANRSTDGRKRKPRVRQRSGSHEQAAQLLDVVARRKGGVLSDDDSDGIPLNKLEVRNPSVGEGRLGLREQDVGLVRDGTREEEDNYMPLPTPTRVHQFSVGEPAFESPRGRKARQKAVPKSQNTRLADVLPAHPRQIMSPPLESQIYFSPMLSNDVAVGDGWNNPGLASPRVRVRGSVRPKSTSRAKSGSRQGDSVENSHGVPHPSGVTTSPLRIATGRVTKSKGKLVKAAPPAKGGV